MAKEASEVPIADLPEIIDIIAYVDLIILDQLFMDIERVRDDLKNKMFGTRMPLSQVIFK